MVSGGDEPMCIPDTRSAWWQQEHGRPCPRVELHPANLESFTLMGWMIHDDLKPLLPEYARALLHGRSAEERAAVYARAANALRSAEVSKRLRPEPKED